MIRLYQKNDIDDVISVFLSAIRETGSRYYSPSQVDAWARVYRDLWERRRFEKPTWIVEMEGEVAGFTDLEPDGHVDMLFVHPNFGTRPSKPVAPHSGNLCGREQDRSTLH